MPIPLADRSDVDIQIATAHRYPRSITRFKQTALAMATSDEDTAASCFYKLKRGDKEIEGPGVRLAEIVGSAWNNLRYGSRIVGEDEKWVIAQGMAHDLENNVAMTIEVRRRITDKYGKRYSDDMVAVTANAACAIALRNAIFKVVPKTFVDAIYESAKKVAIGDATTLVSRRQKALEYFQKLSVSLDRILAVLGKAGLEDINLKDLETLTGLKTAIKDGDTTIEAAFPAIASTSSSNSAASKTENLAENLKKKVKPEPGAG
ncbi:MAG TPA: hypothetical protein DF383_13290 [Deltaproteobacteria bacterium]|nr:hypothetical protein [Deltaproteobacteria bacterium]